MARDDEHLLAQWPHSALGNQTLASRMDSLKKISIWNMQFCTFPQNELYYILGRILENVGGRDQRKVKFDFRIEGKAPVFQILVCKNEG